MIETELDLIKRLDALQALVDCIDIKGTSYVLMEEALNEIPSFSIPDACKYCSNHPSNGGSGICHCILGNQVIC